MGRRATAGHTGGEALWRFSLALYARPGVAKALLALQDRGGSDVNLILFALWRGAVHGHRLAAEDVAEAAAAVAPIGPTVIVPLRTLRRGLKAADDALLQALRRRIAALELAGEQCAQHRLAASVAAAPRPAAAHQRLAAATANLGLYLNDEAGSAEAAVITAALAAVMRCGQDGA